MHFIYQTNQPRGIALRLYVCILIGPVVIKSSNFDVNHTSFDRDMFSYEAGLSVLP